MYLPSTSQIGRLHNMPADVVKPETRFDAHTEEALFAKMAREAWMRDKGSKKQRQRKQTLRDRLGLVLSHKWQTTDELATRLKVSCVQLSKPLGDLLRDGVIEKRMVALNGDRGLKGQWRRREGEA